MTPSARIRFCLKTTVLSAGYYYLLVYVIGWMSARHWPSWWYEVFTSRHTGAVIWLVILHTAAVLVAALPIATLAVIAARQSAVLLGLTSATTATVLAVLPSFAPAIWPIIWASHPTFFITDQVTCLSAVPFLAWALRSASSNNRLERSRGVPSMSQGGSR